MDKAGIRRQSARAIVKQAERAAQRGTSGTFVSDDEPLKPGWERSGADFCPPIKPEFLRQAVAYYDEAIAIDPAEGFYPYQQGLLLEQLSDFAAAIKAFEASQAAGYPAPAFLIERCQAKLNGTHDAKAALLENMNKQFEQSGAGNNEYSNLVSGVMQDMLAGANMKFVNRPDSRSAPLDTSQTADMEGDPAQPMIEFAERFVWLLVKQDFGAAHALLTPEMANDYTAEDLKQDFDDLVAETGEIEGIESSFIDLTDEDQEDADDEEQDDFEGSSMFKDLILAKLKEIEGLPPSVIANFTAEGQDDSGEKGRAAIYVCINGSEEYEAITVTLTGPDEALKVCELEWGRAD